MQLLVPGEMALGTNANEPIGVGARSRARGGADIAVGDSALTQIDNPAALTLLSAEEYRLDASGQLITVRSHWSGPVDSADAENSVPPPVNVGVAIPIDDRLTWGVAFHSKSGLSARYQLRHVFMPFMERRVLSDLKNVALSTGVGYKLTDKLSVGAAVRGEGVTAKYDVVLGPADVHFGRGYSLGGGFNLGLHHQTREDLALALAYRSTTWLGDIAGGDGEASPLGRPPVDLGTINLDEPRLPQKITGGVAWDATDWLKLVGELRWINHSNSSGGSSMYATDGQVDIRLPVNLDLEDQWVVATGAELALDEHWRLGVGYNYGSNVTSPSGMIPTATVIVEHHITIGLRYEADRWWVGGGYILGLPASMDGAEKSHIPLGVDYGYGSIRQEQHSVFLGFGFSW